MDTVTALLSILGSLGVFLFGMKVMSEGIQQTAGDGMRRVMATMTGNRFGGIGTGFLTTALLQSSSATTVIVVSFVNAGLLTLIESIGVIMGANLGTTLTAWIIALIGKFSLAKIALPLIGIGFPLFFAAKGKLKSFGQVLIGFGLLFYGLDLLKSSVPDVKSMLASSDPLVREKAESVGQFIGQLSGHGYFSVLIFLAIGIVLTLIVQSSSAAMAITVTLAINGWIGFADSAAIVLGENIGTTVTAWLASIGTSLSAKRAARAHFMFNALGVIWMLVVFYFFTQMVAGWKDDSAVAALPADATPAMIDGTRDGGIAGMLPESFKMAKHDSPIGWNLAIFHTLFNLCNIILLVGFVPLIAKIVTKWVKGEEGEGRTHRLKHITQNMVNVGELNLPEARNAVSDLAKLTSDMFSGYVEVFRHPERDLSKEVKRLKKLEDEADIMTHDITEYLVRTSAAEITSDNAQSVTRMLRMVGELEEISDSAYRLVEMTQRKYNKNRSFDDEATSGLLKYAESIEAMISFYSDKLFQPMSAAEFEKAATLAKASKVSCKDLNKRAMKRMQSGDGEVKSEILTIDMNNQLALIGQHSHSVLQTTYYDANPSEVPDKFDDV